MTLWHIDHHEHKDQLSKGIRDLLGVTVVVAKIWMVDVLVVIRLVRGCCFEVCCDEIYSPFLKMNLWHETYKVHFTLLHLMNFDLLSLPEHFSLTWTVRYIHVYPLYAEDVLLSIYCLQKSALNADAFEFLVWFSGLTQGTYVYNAIVHTHNRYGKHK